MSQFVTTTPLLDMRPVGSAGDRSLPRLEAVLAREFKSGVAIRHAEPIERRDGAGIDWYVENDNDDPIVRLNDLPADIAAYYKARLDADVATISNAISAYEARSDQAARSSAAALKNAICYPGDENLWIMGDPRSGTAKIVITAWGYEPRTSELTAGHVIHRRERIYPDARQAVIDQPPADEQAAAPPAAVTAVRETGNWRRVLSSLLWVIALILPFAIGWYLLPACGIRVPFTQSYIYGWGDGAFCRQLANPQIETGRAQQATLNADLATARDEVRAKVGQCVVTPPAPPAADEALIEAEGLQIDPDETSVSLTWHNTNDLDLSIECPDKTLVPLGPNGERRCGFKHKIDKNVSNPVSNPVEYIKHEGGPLERGTYKVLVRYYNNNDPSQVATPFTVSLRMNGIKREIQGKTSARIPRNGNKETITVTEFTVP